MTKITQEFRTNDGMTFGTEKEATRHELLVEARDRYDAAQKAFALRLLETKKTADGHDFQFNMFRDYYYITDRYHILPQLDRVSFVGYNMSLNERDEAILERLSDGRYIEHRITELYADETAADIALLEAQEKRLGQLQEDIAKVKRRNNGRFGTRRKKGVKRCQVRVGEGKTIEITGCAYAVDKVVLQMQTHEDLLAACRAFVEAYDEKSCQLEKTVDIEQWATPENIVRGIIKTLETAVSSKREAVDFGGSIKGEKVNRDTCPACNSPIPNPLYDLMVERLMTGELFNGVLEVALERVLTPMIYEYLRDWADDSLRPDLIKAVSAEKESLIGVILSQMGL